MAVDPPEPPPSPSGLPIPPPSAPEPGPPETRRSASVLETLFAGLSAALLFSFFLLIPVAGSIALAFAAVPLVRVTHRRGLIAGLAGSLLVGFVLAAVGLAMGGPSQAVASAIVASLATALPVLAAGAVRSGLSSSKAYLLLLGVGFAVLAGALAIREASEGVPLRDEIGRAFDAMSPASAAHGSETDAAARTAALYGRFKRFAQDYWIGLVGASWALASAVSFYLGARVARPAPSAERARFEELRVPSAIVALFVAAGAGFAMPHGSVQSGAADVLMPLLALYFLAGLSIICHFARRWFRARILRAGLYALVIYFPLNVGVGLLGLFDWYADFRRRGEKAGTNP